MLNYTEKGNKKQVIMSSKISDIEKLTEIVDLDKEDIINSYPDLYVAICDVILVVKMGKLSRNEILRLSDIFDKNKETLRNQFTQLYYCILAVVDTVKIGGKGI